MLSQPLITTIIPTYQRPQLLRRAIQSVLNQTYPHFLVCVYDNASGDETASVVAALAKVDSRIRYHCHTENIGALNNFLYGAEHVETPFFSFLSDDDLLLPEFYQIALAGFERYPEAMFSATLVISMDNQGTILGVHGFTWKEGFYQPPEGLLAMLKNGHIAWTGILFRMEVLEKVSLLEKKANTIDDSFFELRIASRFPFVVSRKHGAIYVIHPDSTWAKVTVDDIWPSWLIIIDDLTENEQIPVDIRIYAKRVLEERLRKILVFRGAKAIVHGNYPIARKTAEALRTHYYLRTIPFLLLATAKVCEHSSVVHQLVRLLAKTYKFFISNPPRHLQKKFSHLSSYLNL